MNSLRPRKLQVIGAIAIALLPTGAFAQASQCFPAPEALVAWWPGDGDAVDIQGSNHGTLQNGASFAAGQVAEAFSFDGVDDALTTPLVVSYSTGVTFDAWIKTSDDRGIIMSGGGGASLERGMGVFVEPGGILSLFGTRNVNSQLNFLIQAGSVSDGVFHHIAGTWTGDTSTDGVKLYLDGVLVGTATAVTSIGTDSLPLNVGGHTTLAHHKLAGLIDEVEVFSRPLTATEIEAIFDAGAAGKCKDEDGDGFRPPQDCDETNASINPGAVELPGNFVDENCNGDLGACDPCNTWRNHGEYVRCVANEVEALVSGGVITQDEADALVASAAQSNVGRKGFVPAECQ